MEIEAKQISHEAWHTIVEADRAHNKKWSDISELNYWARKIGFQKLDKQTKTITVDIYKLVEVKDAGICEVQKVQ